MNNHQSHKFTGFTLFLVFIILLSACSGMAGEAAMQVWLDEPLNGSMYQPGESVIFMAHARDVNGAGISEIQFYLNGEKLVTIPTDSNSALVNASASWQATEGEFELRARAVSNGGGTMDGNPVQFSVRGPRVNGPIITDTPTLTVTTTKTITPTATNTPYISVTPTFTPTYPLPVISFTADTTNLNAGQCTYLNWSTSYVTALYLNGVEVEKNGSSYVCPYISTTYILTALTSYGTIEKEVYISVNVTCPAGANSDFAALSLDRGPCGFYHVGEQFQVCYYAKYTGENLWTFNLIDIKNPYFDSSGKLLGDMRLLTQGSLTGTNTCTSYTVTEPYGFEAVWLRLYNYGTEVKDQSAKIWLYVIP